jgi:uncharacterized membrane protein HdeD (DUF308 family)
MTDPPIDPAGSPGQEGEGGAMPPTSSGQQPGGKQSSGKHQTRHGLFHRGTPAQQAGQPSTYGPSAGSTATSTRQTSTSTEVPQQAGTMPSAGRDRDYQTGAAVYDRPGGNALAKAANASWTVLLFGSLCMIAAGILLLVWPSATLTIVAILIGAALVGAGIVRLWEGFTASDKSGGARAGYVVIGLLAILAGLYCLRHHSISIFLIAFVAGVYFVMQGIADLGVAFSTDTPGRGLRAVLGIFSIGAGLVLVIWPSLSLILLLTITGAWLLLYGCVLGALAFGVRRDAKAMSRQSTSAAMAAPRTA